jgi:hypothetical protein
VIHGDGAQIRAWCFVDDIVEALLAILERDEAVGEVFNIGNPRSVVTVFDLASRIRRLAGSESEIVFRPLHYTDVEMRIPNVDKARKLLDWEPRVDLDEGVARTIAWYRERRPSEPGSERVKFWSSRRRGRRWVPGARRKLRLRLSVLGPAVISPNGWSTTRYACRRTGRRTSRTAGVGACTAGAGRVRSPSTGPVYETGATK